jgi:hypothetical protein
MSYFQCPRCEFSKAICIKITTWSHVDEEGSDPDWRRCPDHDHDWDEDSEACCVKCEWGGTVKDLIEIDDDEDEEDEV